jgi:hypothetical protein
VKGLKSSMRTVVTPNRVRRQKEAATTCCRQWYYVVSGRRISHNRLDV